MADVFTSLIALTPQVGKVMGKGSDRIPGVDPKVKDGIWGERALAPGGSPQYVVASSLNAEVVP
jgi:hypothetical protein